MNLTEDSDVNGGEETTTDSSTETKQDSSVSTESPEKALNRTEKRIAERAVPFKRFNEVNEKAKVTKEIQAKLGLSDEEFSNFVNDPKAYMSQESYESSLLEKKFKAIEDNLNTVVEHQKRQVEEAEWRAAVSKTPELEQFRDVVMGLGRTSQYADMPYEDIYNRAIAPGLSALSAKKKESKERARVQTPGGATVAPEAEDSTETMTEAAFAKLSRSQQEEYLKKIGAL